MTGNSLGTSKKATAFLLVPSFFKFAIPSNTATHSCLCGLFSLNS